MAAWTTFGLAVVLLFSHPPGAGVAVAGTLSEKNLSDVIADSATDGRPVWLTLDQDSFLSIFLEAHTRKATGAVLIIPGISEHANSEGMIRVLRISFAAHGFAAMSLQIPVRNQDTGVGNEPFVIENSGNRIRAALEYVKARKIKHVIVIGHGIGAWRAVDYWMTDPKPGASALVLIGMPVFPDDQRFAGRIETLKSLRIPVLDIFGDRDLNPVVESADLRRRWMQENEAFRQIKIAGGRQGLYSETDWVFKRIYSWIKRYVLPLKAKKAGSDDMRLSDRPTHTVTGRSNL